MESAVLMADDERGTETTKLMLVQAGLHAATSRRGVIVIMHDGHAARFAQERIPELFPGVTFRRLRVVEAGEAEMRCKGFDGQVFVDHYAAEQSPDIRARIGAGVRVHIAERED